MCIWLCLLHSFSCVPFCLISTVVRSKDGQAWLQTAHHPVFRCAVSAVGDAVGFPLYWPQLCRTGGRFRLRSRASLGLPLPAFHHAGTPRRVCELCWLCAELARWTVWPKCIYVGNLFGSNCEIELDLYSCAITWKFCKRKYFWACFYVPDFYLCDMHAHSLETQWHFHNSRTEHNMEMKLTSIGFSHWVAEDSRAHGCKPWVINLLSIPHTLGILAANITYCRISFDTLMSIKWMCT